MRDFLKTVTYGAMHFTVAVAVAYAISGSWQIALGIGLIEPVVQTIFYAFRERAWRLMPSGALPTIGLGLHKVVCRR